MGELITQGEAATILGVDRTTLWRWEREGQIEPQQKVGRTTLYRRSYVEDYAKRLRESGSGAARQAASA